MSKTYKLAKVKFYSCSMKEIPGENLLGHGHGSLNKQTRSEL